MKLYLVRHATPVSAEVDPERPLSDQGFMEARKSAEKLNHIRPTRIYHSGKARARQTAEAFSEATGSPVEQAEGLKPNDDPSVWAGRLEAAAAPEIMLVGHLPYMARLVGLLVNGDPEDLIMDFDPATVACLEFKDGKWDLIKTLNP
ncbi:phosphohistidine phosphatase SixA [Nitrospirota bacterium]